LCCEAAELEESTVVTKVVVVGKKLAHTIGCVEETQPAQPGALRPLFDLVAVRHDCGGSAVAEHSEEQTRFHVVACAEARASGY